MTRSFLSTVVLIIVLAISASTADAQYKTVKKHKHHKHSPCYKYSKLPRWGHAARVVPSKSVLIKHSRANFHFHNGVYYKKRGNKYIVVAAPVGVKIATLPKAKIRMIINGKKYFYYYGTFYEKLESDNKYIVVKPPVGAQVDALPEGYREIEFKGKTIYEFEGTYYEPIIKNTGEEWYKVVKTK